MTRLTLDLANAIIVAALAKGAELKMKPLSVAVLDPGGHMIAFQRQDGASLMRAQIATAKAAGALALGVASRKIAEMAAERPSFIVADGHPIGAVGITGDTSDNDELAALAGIAAAGLTAQG